MNRQELMKQKVKEVLVSKKEELALLGYDNASIDEIWDCVNESYGDDWPKLHQIVNDITSLTPTQLMNWLTLRAYKGTLE